MPKLVQYRCRNCGHRFSYEALSPEEVREAQRRGDDLSRIHCPRCNRTDLDRE
ncbi:zinc ribbon domain-containing protein [Rhodopseudomonas palustris]|uniref:Zinc ribbon domain-containing protein n=1 Tax=Rhodopseudomonas palustris TaxID=1076 RepID=A0A323UH48_RHOPL|nr:zinc ribbon domain-containing protein [Rhodopseudomonas palustris]